MKGKTEKQNKKNAKASHKTNHGTILRVAQADYKMGVCVGCFPANTGPAPKVSGRLPLCHPNHRRKWRKGSRALHSSRVGLPTGARCFRGNPELSLRCAAALGPAPVLASTGRAPGWPEL